MQSIFVSLMLVSAAFGQVITTTQTVTAASPTPTPTCITSYPVLTNTSCTFNASAPAEYVCSGNRIATCIDVSTPNGYKGLLAFSDCPEGSTCSGGNGQAPTCVWCSLPPPLGSCAAFAVMGGSAISFNGQKTFVNTGKICCSYLGSVGVSPGTAVTGNFQMGTGAVEDNTSAAVQCSSDYGIAFNAAQSANCPANQTLASADLAGLTLTPGVYCSASLTISAATLTLDGQNSTNPFWIFQSTSTLTTATATSFILINGAQAKNVYWVLGTSASIGYTSSFVGNILAGASVTYGSNSQIVGRAIAGAAVTFESGSQMSLPQ